MAGYTVRSPISVEDIVERYLNLRLIYDDLERILRRNVLGVTYVELRVSYSNFLGVSAKNAWEWKKFEKDAFFAGQTERMMLC